jgi:hypothetical protein
LAVLLVGILLVDCPFVDIMIVGGKRNLSTVEKK